MILSKISITNEREGIKRKCKIREMEKEKSLSFSSNFIEFFHLI